MEKEDVIRSFLNTPLSIPMTVYKDAIEQSLVEDPLARYKKSLKSSIKELTKNVKPLNFLDINSKFSNSQWQTPQFHFRGTRLPSPQGTRFEGYVHGTPDLKVAVGYATTTNASLAGPLITFGSEVDTKSYIGFLSVYKAQEASKYTENFGFEDLYVGQNPLDIYSQIFCYVI